MGHSLLSQVPRASQSVVSAIVRMMFAQPNHGEAKKQLAIVVEQLEGKIPKAMEVLERTEEDVLAYKAFPNDHGKQVCSTNPRLNRELSRCFDVVGIFPHRESVNLSWRSNRPRATR